MNNSFYRPVVEGDKISPAPTGNPELDALIPESEPVGDARRFRPLEGIKKASHENEPFVIAKPPEIMEKKSFVAVNIPNTPSARKSKKKFCFTRYGVTAITICCVIAFASTFPSSTGKSRHERSMAYSKCKENFALKFKDGNVFKVGFVRGVKKTGDVIKELTVEYGLQKQQFVISAIERDVAWCNSGLEENSPPEAKELVGRLVPGSKRKAAPSSNVASAAKIPKTSPTRFLTPVQFSTSNPFKCEPSSKLTYSTSTDAIMEPLVAKLFDGRTPSASDKKCYVYILFNEFHEIFYIGFSCRQPIIRLMEHKRECESSNFDSEKCKEFASNKKVFIKVAFVSSKEISEELEALFIKTFASSLTNIEPGMNGRLPNHYAIPNMEAVLRHMLVHAMNSGPCNSLADKIKCDFCPNELSSYFAYANHLKEEHEFEGLYGETAPTSTAMIEFRKKYSTCSATTGNEQKKCIIPVTFGSNKPFACNPTATTGPDHLCKTEYQPLLTKLFEGRSFQIATDKQCTVYLLCNNNGHIFYYGYSCRPLALRLYHHYAECQRTNFVGEKCQWFSANKVVYIKAILETSKSIAEDLEHVLIATFFESIANDGYGTTSRIDGYFSGEEIYGAILEIVKDAVVGGKCNPSNADTVNCDICGNSIGTANIGRHFDGMHSNSAISCLSCDATFSSQMVLKRHMENVHSGIRYGCISCNKDFASKDYLTQHVLFVHLGKTLKCPQCEKTFKAFSNWKTHIRADHEGVRWECNLCGKQFKSQDNVSQHKKSQHGPPTPRLQCSQCPKTFTTTSSRNNHERQVHGPPVTCEFCQKVLKTQSVLNSHKRKSCHVLNG